MYPPDLTTKKSPEKNNLNDKKLWSFLLMYPYQIYVSLTQGQIKRSVVHLRKCFVTRLAGGVNPRLDI